MKKIITTLLLIFIFNFSKAQSYIPLHLDIGTCWFSGNTVSTGANINTVFDKTTILKDTFINNFHYYLAYKVSTSPPNPMLVTHEYLLRNDTINKKVFYYVNGQDSLVYDFNLGIGDTIINLSDVNSGSGKIVDTMGVMQVYGVNRKFYGVKNICFDNLPAMLIIEGIGESRGFMRLQVPSTIMPSGGVTTYFSTSSIECAFQSHALYGDSSYAINCAPLKIEDYFNSNNINIFPNPFNNELNLVSDKILENASVKIFNIIGATILHKQHLNGLQFSFDISNYENGLYFLELTEGYKSFRIKVMKN